MLPTKSLSSILLAIGLVALVGCNQVGPDRASLAPGVTPGPTAAVVWPRPADTLAKTVATGLTPETVEHLATHVHAHLDIFIDGMPVIVPAGIGINIDDPNVVKSGDPVGYGGITGCAQPCISPLHTHAESGVLHTESAGSDLNNLGQFFDEWGVALTTTCVGDFCSPGKAIAIYLDGTQFTGDPREIQLSNLREIAIVIGTPPPVIPRTADFSVP